MIHRRGLALMQLAMPISVHDGLYFMNGTSIRLSPSRVFISDMSEKARRMPQGVLMRRISLLPANDLRKGMSPRPPWTALFAKAWAEIAAELPELRRTYVTLPWPHLFEHAVSVASIMVEREIDGEKVLFPARVKSPAERTLAEVIAEIELARTAPIGSIRHNRVILLVSRLPRFLRRMLWWIAFNRPRHRAHYAGTFGVSAVGHLGASILVPVSPLTTFIGYGPFAADGTVDITVGFDHRVMDGAVIARAMGMLEARLASVLRDAMPVNTAT
jgi:hypothetical protein